MPLRAGAGYGRALARETGRRYLLSQLLVEYANRRFDLAASGQPASAEHPGFDRGFGAAAGGPPL